MQYLVRNLFFVFHFCFLSPFAVSFSSPSNGYVIIRVLSLENYKDRYSHRTTFPFNVPKVAISVQSTLTRQQNPDC